MDPCSAGTIQYLRAIQGHSGGKHTNPTLQDNVSLPDDFAEHIYHVGSSQVTQSIFQSGLIPGGKDVKKGRHAVFMTAVNPMYIDLYREKDYEVTKPRIAANKHNLKIHQNTVYWCNLRVHRVKDCSVQTRSNAIILYNTLPAMCIETVVVMMSGEELYNKTYQSLEPNLNYERQDTTSSDARKSLDHSDKHGGMYRETCRGEKDFRIQGLHHSTVQEHDHIRKQAVQKFIHQLENHPNKEALQENLQQHRAFNPFSEKSKEMIYSMGSVEYFEICEVTPNIQCTNCMTHWPDGIENSTCGTC